MDRSCLPRKQRGQPRAPPGAQLPDPQSFHDSAVLIIPAGISSDLCALVSARGVGGAATRKQRRIPSRSRRTIESKLLRDGISPPPCVFHSRTCPYKQSHRIRHLTKNEGRSSAASARVVPQLVESTYGAAPSSRLYFAGYEYGVGPPGPRVRWRTNCEFNRPRCLSPPTLARFH